MSLGSHHLCELKEGALLPRGMQVAAHQLVFSLWSLCSFATVPLEQVALAFVPLTTGDLSPSHPASPYFVPLAAAARRVAPQLWQCCSA